MGVEKQIKEISKSRVRAYGKSARNYDSSRYSSFYLALSDDIIDGIVRPARTGLILDVATGTGRVLIDLQRRDYKVIGIDLTKEMLLVAKEKAERMLLDRINLIQGDALHLPFQNNTFEAVVCTRFLHIMPYEAQKRFINEMGRVLKPAGLLVCEFHSPFWGIFLRWTWVGRRYPRRCTWPRQIKELFADYRIVAKKGISLPGMNIISKTDFNFALFASRFLNFFPLNYLCNQILIVAEKNMVDNL